MPSEQRRKVEHLYRSALELQPDRRAAFLAEACRGDHRLRREIEELLAQDTASTFVHDSSRAEFALGSNLGPYKIEAVIGAGGMGEVFRARDIRLRRTVALKIILREHVADPERKRRLLQEARAASALNHPNIVVLYDLSNHAGTEFLVLEFVPGKTLKELIPENGLPLDDLLRYGAQVASALAAAHEAGVVHRDIKPANIMITPEGQVKVLDFGVAKLAEPSCPQMEDETQTGLVCTTPGRILGTVAYMSPEQIRGEDLDGRSDIFSLGAVLYQAATGRLPFGGASALSMMHEIATADPVPPSSIRPDIPVEVDVIIGRALAKEKDQRYGSAAEMQQALESFRARDPSPSSRSVEPAPLPIVGREQELRRLRDLLTQAVAGSGKFVLLSGEPGIGKSALARAFLSTLQGTNPQVLLAQGDCVEQYGTGEAYLPFLQAVPRLLGGPGRERMLRELGDALGEIAKVSPVVLLLEDLHWADSNSIDLIRHLGQRTRE